MDAILKCSNVCKNIRKKEILKDISLEICKGDVFGLIGPNGAGKTTLIKLILGLQSITSGNITINGFDVSKDFTNAIKSVGAIVENPDFYMYLSGRRNLELVAKCYDISDNKIDEVVKLVGLDKRINDKVSKYSLGMRQRLGIAMSLLNNPNLLILDEPTNGLDPIGIKDLRDIIETLRKSGKIAILVSSHILEELEKLCNKICIIKDGVIVDTSCINNKENSFLFSVDNTSSIHNLINNIEIINNTKFKVQRNRNDIPLIIKRLIKNNINIYSVEELKSSLEDKFFIKTGGK